MVEIALSLNNTEMSPGKAEIKCQVAGKSDEWRVLTEGIEGPNAIRESILLTEGALIEPMVCETVHEDTVCSLSLWRHT